MDGISQPPTDLGAPGYVASPYAAWERGTNENTNGLLRDYFPKQTDFSMITARQLASVVEELNNTANAAPIGLQPKSSLGLQVLHFNLEFKPLCLS